MSLPEEYEAKKTPGTGRSGIETLRVCSDESSDRAGYLKIPQTFSLYHTLSKVFCNGFIAQVIGRYGLLDKRLRSNRHNLVRGINVFMSDPT